MNSLNDIIAEIKGNVNVLDLIERYNLQPKKTGRQYQCLCPFHQEKTPSFTVNISKGYYKCFGCDWSGDVIEFVKEFNKLDTVAACKELVAMYGLNITFDNNFIPQQPKKQPQRKPEKHLLPVTLPHLEFATFPDDYKVVSPPTNRVKTKKHPNPEVTHIATTSYIYSSEPLSWKQKTELFNHDNRLDKTFDWMRLDSFGDTKKGKGDFTGNCYKLEEAINFGEGKIIAITEGEKDVETLRRLGIVAISFDSSNYNDLKSIKCDGFVIFDDNDEAGKNKSQKIADYCIKNQIPFLLVPIAKIWSRADDKSDITDYYEHFRYWYDDDPEGCEGSLVDFAFIRQLKDDLLAVLEEDENDRIAALEYSVQNQETPEIENPDESEQEPVKTENPKGISFAKTLKQLQSGKKTVTRRIWADSTAKTFTKYFEEGVLIPALSKDRRYGGTEVGKIRLIAAPFKQSLKLMTANDVIKEGFPTLSVKQFCDRFFDGNLDQEVWVIEFEFFPNQPTQEDQDTDEIIRVELSDEEREQFYTEEAINELFMDGYYCSIAGKLYKFTGTHYQEVNEATEKRRIANWLRKYSHKLATRDKVSNVWDWVLIRFGVNPDEINPSGLNLLNGVLEVVWDEKNRGSVELKPHSPKIIYTYVSEVIYNPEADSRDCDKLLSCLDQNQQKIFLRTIAASLDLGFVRKHQGRIRALLLSGKGNNGKDTLREVTNLLLLEGMTDATLNDFQQYDNGRKFPLSKLYGKLISWASENSALNRLDALQSLKAAITGDPISIEFKQQEEFSIKPKTVFIFNANEPPQIKTGLEAMKSRWAIINFAKTYSDRPNKSLGELQADPRFKNDPDFLKEKIAPAFLNRIINELSDLAIKGIDYNPIQEAFEDLRKESNHLYQFCSDMKIGYLENGKIYISELWDMLRDWYIDNGTLEVEVNDKGKQKFIWNDQPKKGDSNVKGQNQVYKRFLEIFPNITKQRETFDQVSVGKYYLANIGQIASLASLSDGSSDTASLTGSFNEAVNEAVSLVSRSNEANEADQPYLSKVKNDLVKLDLDQKVDLILQILTPEELPTFEKMLKSHFVRWRYNLPEKVPDTYNHSFRIGDRVSTPKYKDEIGIVLAVEPNFVHVDFPYGKEWLDVSEINPIDDNEAIAS